jgi:hypothetical protein
MLCSQSQDLAGNSDDSIHEHGGSSIVEAMYRTAARLDIVRRQAEHMPDR